MDTIISVIPFDEPQVSPLRREEIIYQAFASNLKRNPEFGRHLGSFQLFIPALDLYLSCSWLRDRHGNEYVGMPRIKVEAPDGKIHHKTLARWATARSEEFFQRAALRALHTLIAKSIQ